MEAVLMYSAKQLTSEQLREIIRILGAESAIIGPYKERSMVEYAFIIPEKEG